MMNFAVAHAADKADLLDEAGEANIAFFNQDGKGGWMARK
jgi:hypothetical protein